MPQNKETKCQRLQRFVTIYGKKFFKTDGDFLMCKVCEKIICSDRKSQIDQRIQTAMHKDRIETLALGNQQLFLGEIKKTNLKSDFNQELAQAMISAGILFCKLENVCLTNFLKKWTRENIPSESLLRKVHFKQ